MPTLKGSKLMAITIPEMPEKRGVPDRVKERIEKMESSPKTAMEVQAEELRWDEIILTKEDVESIIGKKVKSCGESFTATEIRLHGDLIGSEILRNAMRNRVKRINE